MSDNENVTSSRGESAKSGVANSTPFAQNRKVFLLSSETSKKLYRLHKERLVIGSVESADVRLTGDGIAPIHAVLEMNHDSNTGSYSPTIYDLASDSGIFINDTKVVTHLLKDGDLIQIGRHKLRFGLEDLARMSTPTKSEESEGRQLFMNPEEDFSPLLLQENYEIQQIFDYSPTTKSALQVVMSWMDTVLDVEHFVDQPVITIGSTPDCDFGIPPTLSSIKFPLVTQTQGGYILTLDPKMRGVVQRKGELKPLDELRGIAGDYGQTVGLEKGDFAKIAIDDMDFYLSFTVAPPRLKPSKMLERDPLLVKIFMTSLILTAVTVTGLMNAHVPQTIDAEQIPDRLATILYQPEKYAYEQDRSKVVDVAETKPKEQTKPKETAVAHLDIHPNPDAATKPVPHEMNVAPQKEMHKGSKNSKNGKGSANAQNSAKEGQGARANGTEGKRGSKTAKTSGKAQTAANRPSPNGGTGAGAGASQVPDEGNVDVLKGATSQIENILGNSAAALGKGGEKLKGFGGFSTAGNGGLALEGSGKGGGGDANTTLGGLGKTGRGGGRVGTGLGAAGSGSGIVGGQSRMVIRSGGPEEAVVMGSIDADAVEAALLAHKDEFRLCYEREINAENPNIAGRVGTTFVIASSGRVTQAGIESTTLNNANTERCIIQVLKRIDFPIPRGAGTVQVTYPFKFTPVGH
jgi:pSer/pThr/pTyr-binding forkhead associated (FHA) protein